MHCLSGVENVVSFAAGILFVYEQSCARRENLSSGVRDQKGVLRRRWEFPDDPDKGERHNVILMVDGRLQAKIEHVARVELKVADRLIRDENAVRRRGELGEGGVRVAICEIWVGHRSGAADLSRVDSIDILQIGATYA